MQKQTWLPGGLNGYGEPGPIGEMDWMGLAGAVAFANGARPIFWQAETPGDGLVQVCAAAEGCEIHYYEGEGPDFEPACYQFAAPLTEAMGRVVATAAQQSVLAWGPDEAAKRLGFERVC
jgi:hypothetical protein